MTSEHVIFCPQKTEELPKKHNEAGPPEQLLTDALSQIDYKHTVHYTLWRLLVPTNNAKGILEKLSRGNCVWLSRRSPPPPSPKEKKKVAFNDDEAEHKFTNMEHKNTIYI